MAREGGRERELLLILPAGGLSGAFGKMSGVIGDAASKLAFDSEYQEDRKKAVGMEGAAKVGVVRGWGLSSGLCAVWITMHCQGICFLRFNGKTSSDVGSLWFVKG